MFPVLKTLCSLMSNQKSYASTGYTAVVVYGSEKGLIQANHTEDNKTLQDFATINAMGRAGCMAECFLIMKAQNPLLFSP